MFHIIKIQDNTNCVNKAIEIKMKKCQKLIIINSTSKSLSVKLDWLVVLWYINPYRLFNDKACLYMFNKGILFVNK